MRKTIRKLAMETLDSRQMLTSLVAAPDGDPTTAGFSASGTGNLYEEIHSVVAASQASSTSRNNSYANTAVDAVVAQNQPFTPHSAFEDSPHTAALPRILPEVEDEVIVEFGSVDKFAAGYMDFDRVIYCTG